MFKYGQLLTFRKTICFPHHEPYQQVLNAPLSSNNITMRVFLILSSTLPVLCFAFTGSVLLSNTALAQNASVSGYLLNKNSKEVITSGKLNIDGSPKAQSNAFGYFTFSVPEGSHSFTVEAAGFLAFSTMLSITRDTTLRLELSPWEVELDEVRITTPLSNEQGNYRLTAEQIKNVPTVLSEPDVLKVLQLLTLSATDTVPVDLLYKIGGLPYHLRFANFKVRKNIFWCYGNDKCKYYKLFSFATSI